MKIYTLGRFELLKDGKPILFSRKTQQKPLTMLKALIAFGGKEVREDQLGDALWPEALSVYRRCKRTLSASLGIEPSPEIEALHKAIKRGESSTPLD